MAIRHMWQMANGLDNADLNGFLSAFGSTGKSEVLLKLKILLMTQKSQARQSHKRTFRQEIQILFFPKRSFLWLTEIYQWIIQTLKTKMSSL